MVKKVIILFIALIVIGAIVYAIDGYQKGNPSEQEPLTQGNSTAEIEQDLRMDLESSDADFMQLESQINQL